MRFLTYRDLDAGKVKGKLKKVQEAVERDDFRTPDIKKLAQGGVTPKTRTEEQGMSPRSARRLISRWRETDNARTNAQPRIQARSP